MKTVKASQTHENLQNEGCIIDVRTPLEFQEIHAQGAINLPLDEIDDESLKGTANGQTPIYLICKSGKRAERAAEKLEAAGIEDLLIVDGGTDAWSDEGLPVNTGRKVMSLERQVRITAGAIVFTGVLLAHFINPNWMWMSGFVGAGLMFAGITDTCAMGMLIAKAPWNRKTS